MEDFFWDPVSPIQDELTHPGRISSKPAPLCVCRLDVTVRDKSLVTIVTPNAPVAADWRGVKCPAVGCF